MAQGQGQRNIVRHGCRRCGGDLYIDLLERGDQWRHEEDDELVCLQCGRRTRRGAIMEATGSR